MQRPGSQDSLSATGGQAPPPGRGEHRARVLDTGRLCLPPLWDMLMSRDSSGCRTWGRGAVGIRCVEATVRGMADKDTHGSIRPQRPGGQPSPQEMDTGLGGGQQHTLRERGLKPSGSARQCLQRASHRHPLQPVCMHTHRHTCSRVVTCMCRTDSKVPRPLSRAAVCWQEPGRGAWPQRPCFSCEDAPLQTPKGASARHIGTHLGGAGPQWMQAWAPPPAAQCPAERTSKGQRGWASAGTTSEAKSHCLVGL